MSDAQAADARAQRFAEAVRGFAGAPPRRFATLLPLREGVAELRSKGASFAMIRELLATAGVEVSADTVRRFYREVIEEPRAATKQPPKRRRSGPQSSLQRDASAPPASPNSAAAVTVPPPTIAAPTTESPRTRGPRIADPRNL